MAYSNPARTVTSPSNPTTNGAQTTNNKTSNAPTKIRHTFTETTTLMVGILQMVTAWAAFLGALLAYVVVGLQPGRDFEKYNPDFSTREKIRAVMVILRNATSGVLLGAAVTMVASRLSHTQFPVKVSVADFRGALTNGFVAYFIGTKFIANLSSRLGLSSTSPTSTTPSTSTNL